MKNLAEVVQQWNAEWLLETMFNQRLCPYCYDCGAKLHPVFDKDEFVCVGGHFITGCDVRLLWNLLLLPNPTPLDGWAAGYRAG